MGITDYEWHTLAALANGIAPAMDAKSEKYRPLFEQILNTVPVDSLFKLRLVLRVLSFRATAVSLTRSHKLLTEMETHEVQQFLNGLSNSMIRPLRSFFAGLLSATVLTWCKGDPEMLERVGYPKVHPHLLALQAKDDKWNPCTDIPAAMVPDVPTLLSADVVIVGSGCSSMVAAYRLAKQGFSVLILEKGSYLNAKSSPQSDYARNDLAFESNGSLTSLDSSIFILAGSTVGGGGAVNWSCSLRTPEQIRNEWVERGVPFYGERVYDEALDEVERVMRVTHDVKPHSFTNQLIIDSAAKLGYPAGTTSQNTGLHPPNSGFYEFGSRRGDKEGGIGEWLRSAVANGARLLDNTQVVHIRHQNGHASGLDAIYAGQRRLIVNAKRVVVACGSLHTPALLQRSKFKNKRIGQGLKLHPVTLAYGKFDEVVNKRTDPIMTAVSTVTDNLDGKAHGPKLEAIHHQPHLLFPFLPYHSAEDWQSKVDSYAHLSAILVITRDISHGKVSFDSRMPQTPLVEYTTGDYDMWALKQGSLAAANMFYVAGAQRIFFSSAHIPDFVTTKPKQDRSIWDTDYRRWWTLASKVKFENYDVQVGSAHQMASCRMTNKGPKYGPVDAKGHLYECSNVHIIDTSVFPSASGVNPMISCMATAYVLSGYLLDDLKKLATKL